MEETKLCRACETPKPVSEFWRRSETSSGRHSQCKKCCSEKKSAYRKKHTELYRHKNREWHRSIRQQVLAAYGGKCVCCGEATPEFLALDHVHNDGAAERKQHGEGYRIYLKVIREGFPKDRYQLLCHNCNQAKGYYGYCPHAVSKRDSQIGQVPTGTKTESTFV